MKFSTIDFPGVLSCVLFVKGCNLDCFYCHNRGLLTGTENTLSWEENLPFGEVRGFLEKRAGMLDGVVVSGGEPTLHKGLPALLRELKALGYKVKLDTNGCRPQVVKALVEEGLVDYFAVDWKAPPGQYEAVCGAPATNRESTRETIVFLLSAGVPFEVRTTLYPGLDGRDLLALLSELPPVPQYRLNQYKKPLDYRPEDEERLNGPALTPQEIKLLRAGLLAAQPGVMLE